VLGRGTRRLDGARGKKQVWRTHVPNRSFGSKCTVFKKVLVTLLGLFAVPVMIQRQGNCAPCPPVMPLVLAVNFFFTTSPLSNFSLFHAHLTLNKCISS